MSSLCLWWRQVADIVAELGLEVGAWQDGIVHKFEPPFPRSKFASKNVMVYAWKNVWETGMASDIYKLANADYQVRKTHCPILTVVDLGIIARSDGENESACLILCLSCVVPILSTKYTVLRSWVCGDKGHANCKFLVFSNIKCSSNSLFMLLSLWFSLSLCTSLLPIRCMYACVTSNEKRWTRGRWKIITDENGQIRVIWSKFVVVVVSVCVCVCVHAHFGKSVLSCSYCSQLIVQV